MFETFQSDLQIFNNEINALIDSREKPVILEKLKEKHISELESEVEIQDKKNDLIIWNAIYVKEIIKVGVAKRYLHPLYNKYYNLIPTINKLEKLQELEIDMVTAYLDFLISEVEVTESFILNKMLQHIHMEIESHVSVESIAEALNISKGYASYCFKEHMGISLMKYVKQVKIERAKMLLLKTNKSVLDISIVLGFHDQSHFTRTFKALAGVSPTEYRNNNYL